MSFGDNQLHPLQIEDARQAAYQASENQRAVEDMVRNASKDLAEAERLYRKKLTTRMLILHADDGVAWTAAESVARGEKEIADLRYGRDVKEGVLEAARQQAFRRGADRRDLDTLLNWSMRRDLRGDTPPPGFEQASGEVR